MPKSDTWPGGVAMESLSNMASGGSCDSVISMTSGYSEDNMEHLSAEERACLTYLEETIGSLEVNEDSGLSNDEPDAVLEAGTSQMKLIDVSALKLRRSQRCDAAGRVPVSGAAEPPGHMTRPEPPVAESAAGCQTHPLAAPTGLCSPQGGDVNLKGAPGSGRRAEMDVGLILPPSDFRDDPGLPPQPEESESSPEIQGPLNGPPELSTLPISPSLQMGPPPETPEPRSPPAVAPKPKKLPPNIILKSNKVAVADGNSVHLLPTCSERQVLDPQRVHMEALRKLGLLKTDEVDSGPALSPKGPAQTRRHWGAPPVSPAAPCTPAATASHPDPESRPPAPGPPQSPGAGSPSHSFQAPAAFKDMDTEAPADGDVPGVNAPPPNPGALVKELAPPTVRGVQSATMERSGEGPSSQRSTEAAQVQQRGSRPRHASLGCGTEFSINHGEGLQEGHASGSEPGTPRSLPALEPPGDPQKLPRSQGVSVLICPRAEHGDERRRALRRLGLLRD